MNSPFYIKMISFLETLSLNIEYNYKNLYKNFIKMYSISQHQLSQKNCTQLMLSILRDNNIEFANRHSGDKRYVILLSKVDIKDTHFNNTHKILNPLKVINIYRVTTTTHKHVNGLWSYKGKIYYKERGVQSVINVTASNWEDLQIELKATMRKIKS